MEDDSRHGRIFLMAFMESSTGYAAEFLQPAACMEYLPRF